MDKVIRLTRSFVVTGSSDVKVIDSSYSDSENFTIKGSFTGNPFMIDKVVPLIEVKGSTNNKVFYPQNIHCDLFSDDTQVEDSSPSTDFDLTAQDDNINVLSQRYRTMIDVNNSQLNLNPFGDNFISGFFIDFVWREGVLIDSPFTVGDDYTIQMHFAFNIKYGWR